MKGRHEGGKEDREEGPREIWKVKCNEPSSVWDLHWKEVEDITGQGVETASQLVGIILMPRLQSVAKPNAKDLEELSVSL